MVRRLADELLRQRRELCAASASGMQQLLAEAPEVPAAVDAIAWNTSVPKDRVRLGVHNGWITLEDAVRKATSAVADRLVGPDVEPDVSQDLQDVDAETGRNASPDDPGTDTRVFDGLDLKADGG